jgi:integrase/recombinase XerD
MSSNHSTTRQNSPKVSIALRVGDKFWSPVIHPNGKLKPHYAIRNGQPTPCPGAVYYLRYRAQGKRRWERVGPDPQLAQIRKIQRERALAAEAAGVPLAEVTREDSIPLSESLQEYLDEVESHKSHRTFLAYSLALRSFAQACQNPVRQVARKDIMAWIAAMRQSGLDPRTIANRVTYLRTFVRHWEIKWPLTSKDMPRFTKKEATAYTSQDLGSMLSHATQDEADLVFFLLGTGTREQEAQFATWRDVSFDNKTFTTTEKRDNLTFVIKDREEGHVPIPDDLVERLRERRKRYPTTRLIFPGKNGKPDGHHLRTIKRLALRSGVNCGECVNKAGQCCAEHPVCRKAILHRMRKSFASFHSENGVNVRTIQKWLRHSSLDTTLGYLQASNNQSAGIREKVNSAFSQIGVRESYPKSSGLQRSNQEAQ